MLKTIEALLLLLAGRNGKSLFYLFIIAIMILALIPPANLPHTPGSDKFHHALAFSFLTLLMGLSHRSLSRLQLTIAMLGYGVLMELLQSFTSYRMAEWTDLAADVAGICAGLLLLQVIKRNRTDPF
jgi:VanZ family protein